MHTTHASELNVLYLRLYVFLVGQPDHPSLVLALGTLSSFKKHCIGVCGVPRIAVLLALNNFLGTCPVALCCPSIVMTPVLYIVHMGTSRLLRAWIWFQASGSYWLVTDHIRVFPLQASLGSTRHGSNCRGARTGSQRGEETKPRRQISFFLFRYGQVHINFATLGAHHAFSTCPKFSNARAIGFASWQSGSGGIMWRRSRPGDSKTLANIDPGVNCIGRCSWIGRGRITNVASTDVPVFNTCSNLLRNAVSV
jgi:hypothetical protein